MIYFVFWYLVVVQVCSSFVALYQIVSAKEKTNSDKVGLLIGTIFRVGVTAIFLYAVYPVLQFV